MKSTHSIIVKEKDLAIPLNLKGVISYFNSHQPSSKEIDECKHIELTSNMPWNPMSDELEQDEENYTSKTSGDTESRHNVAVFRQSNKMDTMLESLDQTLSDNF